MLDAQYSLVQSKTANVYKHLSVPSGIHVGNNLFIINEPKP